jgi:hypothetical protein
MLPYPSKFNFELGSYILLVSGVVGDHTSTYLGLRKEGIYEKNSIALTLMQSNMWVTVDVLLISIIIACTYLGVRKFKSTSSRYLFILPGLTGVIRLGVAMSNFILLI